MDLIHNEQTKLTANAINTVASSCFAIGALAPIVAALYGAGPSDGRTRYVIVGAVVWISVAVALHFGARRVLRGLRE